MKLLFTFFGKSEKCAEKDGNPYPETNWWSAYVGRPDKKFAYFTRIPKISL